jgi:hypothetical protein
VFNRRSHARRRAGFPHSDILGSTSGYRLPQAYRRFPRPSSAPVAKASTMRPEKLSHTTAKPSMSKSPHHDTAPPRGRIRHHVRASKMTTFSAPPHHARGRDHGGNKNKMLASTMQFPNNNPHHTYHAPHTGGRLGMAGTRTPGPPEGTPPGTTTPTQHGSLHHWPGTAGPVVPGPNSVPTPPRPSGPGDAPLPLAGATPRPRPRRPFQTRYYENPPAGTTTGHDSLMFHP